MTRINLIDPAELCRQHLIAKYRELPRIFTLVRKAFWRGERPDDPRNPCKYVLGAGHCRFFYSRLGWLQNRFSLLVNEIHRRGYHASFKQVDASGIPVEWFGDFVPDDTDIELNRRRIRDRTPQ